MNISPVNTVGFKNSNMKINLNSNNFYINNFKNNNIQSDTLQISFKGYKEDEPSREWDKRSGCWSKKENLERLRELVGSGAFRDTVLIDDVPYYKYTFIKAQEIFDVSEIPAHWERNTFLKERPGSVEEYKKASLAYWTTIRNEPERPFLGKLSPNWNDYVEDLKSYLESKRKTEQLPILYNYIKEGRIQYIPGQNLYHLESKSYR